MVCFWGFWFLRRGLCFTWFFLVFSPGAWAWAAVISCTPAAARLRGSPGSVPLSLSLSLNSPPPPSPLSRDRNCALHPQLRVCVQPYPQLRVCVTAGMCAAGGRPRRPLDAGQGRPMPPSSACRCGGPGGPAARYAAPIAPHIHGRVTAGTGRVTAHGDAQSRPHSHGQAREPRSRSPQTRPRTASADAAPGLRRGHGRGASPRDEGPRGTAMAQTRRASWSFWAAAAAHSSQALLLLGSGGGGGGSQEGNGRRRGASRPPAERDPTGMRSDPD